MESEGGKATAARSLACARTQCREVIIEGCLLFLTDVRAFLGPTMTRLESFEGCTAF